MYIIRRTGFCSRIQMPLRPSKASIYELCMRGPSRVLYGNTCSDFAHLPRLSLVYIMPNIWRSTRWRCSSTLFVCLPIKERCFSCATLPDGPTFSRRHHCNILELQEHYFRHFLARATILSFSPFMHQIRSDPSNN